MGSNQSSSAGNFNGKRGYSPPTSDDIQKSTALVLEGIECIDAAKYKEAIEKVSQAIVLCPDPILFCSRAGLYRMRNKYDDAIFNCRIALELDPKCANAYLHLGLIFDALKRYDKAIEAYKKALELDPEDEDSRRGLVLAKKKLKTKKQESSPPTSEANSKANALNKQGNECMEASKFNEAIEKYTEAIALKRDPVYLTNRAAAFCRLKKYYDAENDCHHTILLDRRYAKAHGQMGFICSCRGDYLVSFYAYKTALELDPNNDNYKENLALVESELGEAIQQP